MQSHPQVQSNNLQSYQSSQETIGSTNVDYQQETKSISDFFAAYNFDLPQIPVQSTASQAFNDYGLALPSSDTYPTDSFKQTLTHAGPASSAGIPNSASGIEQHAAEAFFSGNTTTSGNVPSHETSCTDLSELTLPAQTSVRNDDQQASTPAVPPRKKRKRTASIADSDDDLTPQEKAQRERAALKQRKNRETICESLVELNELLPLDLRSRMKKPNHRVIDTAIPYFRIMKNDLGILKFRVVELETELRQRQESEERVRSEKVADQARQEAKLAEILTKLQNSEAREREATAKANHYKQQLMAVLQNTRTNVQP
ncbi:hypothetical protein DENSPDRAFT_507022 [Dentipellis sp. KUC8613]|nr:hypothetical protein DENSPDRAFT_507022 [Dentipellis sp. KUC8613]